MLRFLLSLFLFTLSLTTMANTIEGVRLSQSVNDTRLVFDLSDKASYDLFTLKNPDRLVIDLKHTKHPESITLPNLSNTPIRNIRYAEWNNKSVRIVLDLDKAVTFNSQALAPSHGRSHRLVLDLHNSTATQPTRTETLSTVTPAPVQVTPTPQIIEKPQPIVITKKTILSPRRDIVIAIDAGHGGQDSGALGSQGTQEKVVVLAIARRLAKLVNNEPGMRAYLTRDRDVFISLRQRIKRARQNNADMFISIHADAFHNHRARGASVFVLSERGASSEAAQLLADKENAADLAGGISLEDKDDLLASVLLDLSQTASLEASIEVANTVLSGLKRVGNVHKKHVESAAFVVLKSPDIPSLLVETAFISNPDEERKLNSASHQNKLARAMMSGIRNYFRRNPLPGTNMPQQHIVSNGDTLSTIAQRYQVSLNQLKSNNDLTSNYLKVGEVLMIP
ncbi:MAG: N-acetylmuramoyl-L-alanine amidase [Gammaproteobacteria bacterium]|nr:N-acetylmuramoyl-L-alanine amidase [Gammaproteobacteria bacterium]